MEGAEARFLLVDDDQALCRALVRLVRRHGEAALAGTVGGAFKLLAARALWTGFIIDLRLPDGSGLDLLRGARASFPDVPALILTGHTDGPEINIAYDLRAAYVVKPLDEGRLRRFLHAATSQHGEGNALATATLGPAGPATQGRCPEELEARIAELRTLLAQRLDARTRYAIGSAVADIKARPGLYGVGAIAVVATAIGEDLPSLYRHSAVAERWTAGQVGDLLSRRGRAGSRLSWSHLVVLGTVVDAMTRATLVERVLGEGLSVRELCRLAVIADTTRS